MIHFLSVLGITSNSNVSHRKLRQSSTLAGSRLSNCSLMNPQRASACSWLSVRGRPGGKGSFWSFHFCFQTHLRSTPRNSAIWLLDSAGNLCVKNAHCSRNDPQRVNSSSCSISLNIGMFSSWTRVIQSAGGVRGGDSDIVK